ncbi:ABC transporter permease [Roseomonas sp. GC11]|uniref:ABC transporter permease n=1 Tax=Roseomonas sp. GC11 TaxID=2950546 RepID=UPI00210B48C4|nr:ABC transporter permease [Roseomonas sp. GC11]MCQ4161631.1 ABC transporter permease [Roseomonas sp. GC11]
MSATPRNLLPLLVLPAVAVNLFTFLWPMLNLAGLSFREGLPGGGIGAAFSLATWGDLLADEFYLEILLRSVGMALGITGLALLASYPIAFFVHRADARWRNLLVVACISPLLISAVVRTYGWLVILGDAGFLPVILRGLGFAPPRLVFNMTGVVIGLVEILMPYMILSLLAGFGRLNQTLEEAAASLGAPPLVVFWRIVLPLTLPGILLGCLLVFVLTVSSFITPKLLGGGRVLLLATEIYDQAIVTLNWPLAAALSLIALGVFGAALLVYGRISRAAERSIA